MFFTLWSTDTQQWCQLFASSIHSPQHLRLSDRFNVRIFHRPIQRNWITLFSSVVIWLHTEQREKTECVEIFPTKTAHGFTDPIKSFVPNEHVIPHALMTNKWQIDFVKKKKGRVLVSNWLKIISESDKKVSWCRELLIFWHLKKRYFFQFQAAKWSFFSSRHLLRPSPMWVLPTCICLICFYVYCHLTSCMFIHCRSAQARWAKCMHILKNIIK